MSRRNKVPVATYRLQMNAEFTLADAALAVPELAALGVSHVYLSPIFAAVPGSTHGYDVIDSTRVSPELGGMKALRELDGALRRHDMGLILDIVPNHIGVFGALNVWWRDVLRFGQRSGFAEFFDIDWDRDRNVHSGRLVYPCLDRPFGAALEEGQLTLAYDGEELVVRYFDESLPLTPPSYPAALGVPPPDLGDALSDPGALSMLSDLLQRLTSTSAAAASRDVARMSRIVASEPGLRRWIDQQLAERNGTIGDPASFDQVEGVLVAQPYRLAHWRVSGEEVNYRRFFDVNSLAALRSESPRVFTATHGLIVRLIRGGIVTGLRVDHVDGLYAPGEYLTQLRDLVNEAADTGEGNFPIWVEKVLARDEQLPAWPVAGSTGYDFLAVCGELLISATGARALARVYDSFTSTRHVYDDVAYAARKHVAERSFAGELSGLALQLLRLSQRERHPRDNTLAELRRAVAALVACFPVYRTYFDDEATDVSQAAWIRVAATRAVLKDPDVMPEAMDFLTRVLLLSPAPDAENERPQWIRFRRRFQQLTAPVMAKGVEDTTIFRYSRLLALNEVGCAADSNGISSARAHAWFRERAKDWPASMSATSTHDTKRSEDVRNRLAVLSELPREWGSAARTWSRLNASKRRHADGREVPNRETEHYLYQTLVGAWEGRADETFRARILEHMTKALREAKLATSWARVDSRYEEAVLDFVREILDSNQCGTFLEELDRFVARMRPAAALNSLATLTLKCTAPGVPDFYQGSELPIFQLTDPDNRRPLNMAGLSRATHADAPDPPWPVLAETKAWLTKRLLEVRGSAPELFANGNYRSLVATGERRTNLFCFQREHAGRRVLVVVPRV
ncbi:MAG: malto-oligosyltrehalose synthase, partial [Anaerolineaceae bacterium]